MLDDSIKLNNTKWRHIDSGGGISCKINGSKYIEKAAINFSSIRGNKLPESALEKSGVQEIRKYNATGVSVIIHPLNPKTACSHLNIRFFEAKHKGGNVWWFGGGFDLTPTSLQMVICCIGRTKPENYVISTIKVFTINLILIVMTTFIFRIEMNRGVLEVYSMIN